jgi:hypothetical protein
MSIKLIIIAIIALLVVFLLIKKLFKLLFIVIIIVGAYLLYIKITGGDPMQIFQDTKDKIIK